MAPTILVTGATGNVGGATVRALAARRDAGEAMTILGLVRSEAKGEAVIAAGADSYRVGDLNDAASLDAAFDGVTRVVVIVPGVQNRSDLAVNAINAAERKNVGRTVLMSVLGSDTQQILFHKQFYRAERELAMSLAEWSILRAPFFIDNFWGYAEPIKNGSVYLALGEGVLPMTSVRDLGEALATLLTQTGHNERVYSLVGDNKTGVQIAQTFTDTVGHQVNYVPLPRQQSKDALVGKGWPEWQAEGVCEMFDLYRADTVGVHVHDGVAMALLNRAPTTLGDFASENVLAFSRNDEASQDTSNTTTGDVGEVESDGLGEPVDESLGARTNTTANTSAPLPSAFGSYARPRQPGSMVLPARYVTAQRTGVPVYNSAGSNPQVSFGMGAVMGPRPFMSMGYPTMPMMAPPMGTLPYPSRRRHGHRRRRHRKHEDTVYDRTGRDDSLYDDTRFDGTGYDDSRYDDSRYGNSYYDNSIYKDTRYGW